VTVDGAGEDDLAGGVDRARGRRQVLHRRHRDDASAADADGGVVEDLGGGHHAPAGDDEVEGARGHDRGLTGSVMSP